MNRGVKYIAFITLFLSAVSLFSISPEDMADNAAQQVPNEKETKEQVKYDVKKTQITTIEDVQKKNPIDLKDPSNIASEIEYDSENNIYLFKTKIGDEVIVTPFSMSADEYMSYSLKESMARYFRSKDEQEVEKDEKKEGDFSFKDIKISLGPAEKIFGPGGVRIKTQGYTEISMGMKHTSSKNPNISENNRSRFMFDFDQKIQLNVNASVGDKVNFGMNYDTESTFDFDSKKLKLAYEGKEDEIVKHLEAGNVSMSTTNSLINGGSALFGIKAGLQFGKLKVDAVISQQESESKTVNSKGGTQTTPFEFTADQYDENRHFFLSFYFRDNYDDFLKPLPNTNSPVTIQQVEVWITNKRGNFENARNIVAFADLGEIDTVAIQNDVWKPKLPNDKYPNNRANNLYHEMTTTHADARDFKKVTSELNSIGQFEGGLDYEKVESARLLDASEYTFNTQLGYISLRSALQADEVLAIAYKYRVAGEEYQVGEFASQISAQANTTDTTTTGIAASGALFLKLLKPTALSPRSHSWDLMMKNIYSLQGAYQVQKDRFKLNISYQNDSTGTYINYIQAGDIKDKQLLKVMNLDRLDSRGNVLPNGDGVFDFIEGYTILSQNGRVIFPVIEPFGDHLRKQINDTIANKYVYQELYDSTLIVAKQKAEKNKFKISGEYRASSRNEISLGATNVAKGSVKVMAGGTLLQEGVHYTVDYISGTVTMIDDSYANSSISVSLENQSFFSMQRKTMMGLNLSYDFSKDFTIGGTIMHMYEKPMTVKTGFGNESLQNTLWGLNTSYRTQSQWLTNMIDKLPFVNATQPSQINFNAEFAQMIPGHYENKYGGGYSYLDDFETTKSRISIKEPYGWRLSSIPQGNLFKEASSDSLENGKNRALIAWYTIDNLFTRRNSSLAPEHIKNDKNQLSNHYVREVNVNEIYPNKQTLYNETALQYTLNLSYYPSERGPYNLDDDLTNDGYLKNPQKRWGGIMQKINNRDFETNNIEYLEFWMMDPFIYNDGGVDDNPGGDLYINLGEISEDVLKDGMKFYENGLPLNDDPTAYTETVWGKVPTRQSTTYAFNSDLSDDNKRRLDVGLNGLSTQEELEFKAYREYLTAIRPNVSEDAYARFEKDPAGDNYHYFRGADYDRDEVSILDRYKYYNNTEGNATSPDESNMTTTARTFADAEDIDQDYTMNETESYFQYRIKLDPTKMALGSNEYVADSRRVKVKLRNDTEEEITWYQFRIPLKKQDTIIGNIRDFKSIRFVRMFMTGFTKPTHLRFATLDLVRADWRPYTYSLNIDGSSDGQATINVSAINIEENGDREPVNYVLPPDVSRILDPSQPQLRQENEQSLMFQVFDLDPKSSKAVYKTTNYDLRRYKRIQMYTHLEQILGEPTLERGDLSIFLRLGSDYKNNYYEYEIPLTVTPHGQYLDSYNDRLIVWPKENMFDFALELLKDIKLNRNKERRKGNKDVSFTTVYSEYDPENKNNKVSVIGNPSLSEVKVLMIGLKNRAGTSTKSGEVWVNELRLTDFDEEGGWAAQASVNIALSDLGNISVSGRKETAGFGSLDQSLMERRADDFTSYNIATNVDIGRFLPEKAKLSVPFYYSYSKEVTSPDYDPFDQDVKLEESLALVETKQEKDSIKSLAEDKVITKSINFSNVKLNVQSKTPMPYDPANFSLGYSFSETKTSNPTTVYDATQNYRAILNYSYSPIMKSWTPFKDTKSSAPMAKFAKAWSFNYLPSNIAFMTQMNRLYTETMIRDLDSYALGGINSDDNNFLSWSQDFYWDRDFSMSWDFTKNLKTSFTSGTKAEIEEPYRQVNKKLNPSDYEIWKDSVTRSILSLGRPLEYRQNAKITYTLPFNEISYLNWISSTGNYDANYTWNRGAETAAGYETGNTINNNITLGLNSRLNLQTLYNKSAFLKEVNQKFDNSRNNSRNQNSAKKPAAKKKRFEQDIKLLPDSTITMSHNLKTKNILVTAKHDGKTYPIKFKKINENQIQIETKDTANIKLSVIEGPDKSETTWYKIAQYGARGLMSIRSITINVNQHNSTYVPGFSPSIGDAFGQGGSSRGTSPGVGFAFGLDGGEDFINKALGNDWLMTSSQASISPAIYNTSLKVDLKADLEPIKGLKINLNALREKTDRTDFQFMYPGAQNTYGGSFSMTTIALTTAFQSSSANNDYQSAVFDKFLSNRDVIAGRLGREYESMGELNLPINKNSPNVLIPSFLAAYTGRDANSTSLSFFPALLSALPNWNMTYDGLINIPWVKSKFKTLKLSHTYAAQYRIATFESFASWNRVGGDLGYITNTATDQREASSLYDVKSISLTEAFSPLLGAEGTLNNSMTVRARYNKARTLNLNMSAYQIVETGKNEFIVGLGYRIPNFNRVLGLTSNSKGVNNDLNVNIDLSYSNNNTLIRKIEEHFTQATGGTKIFSIKASADYTLSKSLILKAYFDRIMNTPLISSSSYPTTNTDFGVSLRFTLSQ